MKFPISKYDPLVDGSFVCMTSHGGVIECTEDVGWSRRVGLELLTDYVPFLSDTYLYLPLPKHIQPYQGRFPTAKLVTVYPIKEGWSIEQDKLVVGHCDEFPPMKIKSTWVRHGKAQISGWLI